MRDLHGPGIEPMFPALAGGFLTTAPPGKSLLFLSKDKFLSISGTKVQDKSMCFGLSKNVFTVILEYIEHKF